MDAFTSDCLEADAYVRREMAAYRKKAERKEVELREWLQKDKIERLYKQLYARVEDELTKKLQGNIYQECKKKLRSNIEADLKHRLKPELMAKLREEAYAEMKADASKVLASEEEKELAQVKMKLLQLKRQYKKLLVKFKGANKQMLEYRNEIKASGLPGAFEGDPEFSSASELSDSD